MDVLQYLAEVWWFGSSDSVPNVLMLDLGRDKTYVLRGQDVVDYHRAWKATHRNHRLLEYSLDGRATLKSDPSSESDIGTGYFVSYSYENESYSLTDTEADTEADADTNTWMSLLDVNVNANAGSDRGHWKLNRVTVRAAIEIYNDGKIIHRVKLISRN